MKLPLPDAAGLRIGAAANTHQQCWSLYVIRFVLSGAIALVAFASTVLAQAPDPQNTLVIELKTGKVLVKLRPDLAPKHVARAKQLAKQGFYNGLKFHRVIDGFMAQTGDPQGTGMGGSDLPDLPAEFTKEVYKRGSVGAARTAEPQQRQQPVLHLLRRLPPAHWPVHAVGRGHRRHGARRQDRARRAAGTAGRDAEGLSAG